jgi:hypothetical protein
MPGRPVRPGRMARRGGMPGSTLSGLPVLSRVSGTAVVPMLRPCRSTDIIATVDSALWLWLRLVRLRASLQPPVAGSSIAIPASL